MRDARHEWQFGPRLEPDGGVTFRLWAPAARRVDIVTTHALPMTKVGDGWFERMVPDAQAGTRYRFRIDGELDVPDPASGFQPDDVLGASEVIDHAFAWRASGWRGRPWAEAAILEIHIGAFTPEGTFRAAIERLDDVKAAGFTAIELMPVADFFGRWNWGYDGVLWYAPDSRYGRPEDVQRLVDAAHERGLMVFLDVVYNHFGPEGNFLPSYAPDVFANDVTTPWGAAIDYDVPQARAFAIENALHWLDRYRFDGLRLDAVHAIVKRGNPSILAELSRAVGRLAAATGRLIHLVLENDDNHATLIDPRTDPPQGRYRAQWDDDYHHAWHVLLTGERGGYYCDYKDAGAALARCLSCGFAYQGERSAHRGGAVRGEPSAHLPPTAFITFLQNHDQIGNRPRGERLTVLAPPAAIDAALAVTLPAPMPPMMFMGEEWGAREPFPFFCDFKEPLAQAVREGRRKEFREAYRHENEEGKIPDPLAEATFRSAVLDWSKRDRAGHRERLALVRGLLATRAAEIVPHLDRAGDLAGHARARWEGAVLTARWRLDDRVLTLLANLTDRPAPRPRMQMTQPIWGGAPPDPLPPWAVHWAWSEG
jgi:maltooligosyltrehalose trehalohydrolase